MMFAHAHLDIIFAAFFGGGFGAFFACCFVWKWVRENVLEREE
ncbi:hypothetical protein [Tautonia marina]|nr:hypothetical protein [Tautonia marina]